jgi:hypothetical protein
MTRDPVFRTRLLVSVIMAALVAAALPFAFASAESGQIPGNASCRQLLANPTAFEIKIETSSINNGASYGPITFAGVNAAKTLMGFTSTALVEAVFVKGGPNGGHLYDYTAPDPPGGVTSDSNMGTDGYGNGRYQISHVSFCWNAPPTPPPLTAEKTAHGTWDRTVTWDLDKSVDPDSHTGGAGTDAGSSAWTVEATKKERLDNYRVTGDITIRNKHTSPVPVTVTDTLDDGTTATVDCDPADGAQPAGTVPAAANAATPGMLVCSYVATPTDGGAVDNNAVITSLLSAVAGTTAMKAIDWNGNVLGDDEVTLADGRFGYSRKISQSTTKTFPETFPCPADPTLYVAGKYSYSETNEATLTGDATDLSDDATVEVHCTLAALTAEKTAAGRYDRIITWELDKTVDPASHSGAAGQDAGSSTWTVRATKELVEDNHVVAGNIEVHNPSAISQTFTVDDVLDDGTEADVTCPTYTLTAGASTTCTYTADTAVATLNTATVTAPGNAPVVATAPVGDYEATVLGDEEVTLADERFDHEQVIDSSTTVAFPETFPCPADPALYENGAYTYKVINIATLTGDSTDEIDKAKVDVTCNQTWKGETATGQGPRYPKSANWFMFTPYSTGTVDLIAGQHHDAGDITMVRQNGSTKITFELHDGYRFATVKENLKIEAFAKAPTSYVAPGRFKGKFTVLTSLRQITVTVPTADFYGIHVDVERLVT